MAGLAGWEGRELGGGMEWLLLGFGVVVLWVYVKGVVDASPRTLAD